jgi:hypothetical protein
MKTTNRYFLSAMLLCLSSAAFSQAGGQTTTRADNQPEPMVMLVPVEISNKALEAGCWAQFYGERNFKGEMLTVVGPAEIASPDKGNGRQFKRSIDSLVLGPKATLKVYEHQMFKDKAVDFPANSREAGLIKKLGFGGRIESLQLQCVS